jgi:hypothetical protein
VHRVLKVFRVLLALPFGPVLVVCRALKVLRVLRA